MQISVFDESNKLIIALKTSKNVFSFQKKWIVVEV